MQQENKNLKLTFKLENVDNFFSVSLFSARVFRFLSCLSIIVGLYIFATTNDRSSLLLFVFGSFTFFTNSWKIDKNKEYRNIVSLINTMQIRSIDKIAEIVKLPYDTVRRDLQILIDRIKVTNIAIDDTLREIVLH